MKNTLFALLFVVSVVGTAQDKENSDADKKDKEKKEELKKEKQPLTVDPKYFYCYKDATLETDDYKIYLENPIADFKTSKVRVRIFNKTNDYLIFKPSDVVFKVNGQDIPCTDRDLIVPPNEEGSKIIDIKAENLQAKTYTLDIKSLYKVANGIAGVKVEDLNVSKKEAKKKEMTVTGFKCLIKKMDIETGKTIVVTECIYAGEGIGILDPMKVVAIMPKGQENPNADKQKTVLLKKGEKEVFVVAIKEIKDGGDMQVEPFKIKWNDTFKDSKSTPVAGGKVNMELDAQKTAEKNQ